MKISSLWLPQDHTKLYNNLLLKVLNKARAGLRPAPVRIVGMRACVRVCVSAPETINNQWRDVAWYRPHMIG